MNAGSIIDAEYHAGTFRGRKPRFTAVYLHLIVTLARGERSLTVKDIAVGAGVSRQSAYAAIADLRSLGKLDITPVSRMHRHRFNGLYRLSNPLTVGRQGKA